MMEMNLSPLDRKEHNNGSYRQKALVTLVTIYIP